MQWVCVQQPRPKTWLYATQDDTAFIQQPGLGTWLWGARCPVFRCGRVRHVQRRGRTHNGVQGQATGTERAKGVIHSDAVGARVGNNHVWVRQRSERWPSSPSSKYQGGESEYVTKHTTAKTQAKESEVHSDAVGGGCGRISSSAAEVAIHRLRSFVLLCKQRFASPTYFQKWVGHCHPSTYLHNADSLFPPSSPKLTLNRNYDPTRWIIYFLHKFTSLVLSVCRTSDTDVLKSRIYMLRTEASSVKKSNTASARTLEDRAEKVQNVISAVTLKLALEDSDSDSGTERVWTRAELEVYVQGCTSESGKRMLLLIEGRAIDVMSFGKEHVCDFSHITSYRRV